MTSRPDEQYVWIWLPGATEPVVAGRLFRAGGVLGFEYGLSYLERPNAIPIYEPELPLVDRQQLPAGFTVHGCIADAGPDSWGQRVIDVERGGEVIDDELSYLAWSGSDRTGFLDFQDSPREYVPRLAEHASLDELAEAAGRIDANEPINNELREALLYGTAIGGARPKALLVDGSRSLIAKFSSSDDRYPVVKGEFIAMQLAMRCGVEVAQTELTTAYGKDVLLVDRFDRGPDGGRRQVISALTILGLAPHEQRYGSYELLATAIRARFKDHLETQRELFTRVAFHMLCSNTDDHLRNHAAFWDGFELTLTPAYDICPQPRAGGEASLATPIDSEYRIANLAGLVDRASRFQLEEVEAREIVSHLRSMVSGSWEAVCDLAELPAVDRERFWGAQFMNPAAFYGLDD